MFMRRRLSVMMTNKVHSIFIRMLVVSEMLWLNVQGINVNIGSSTAHISVTSICSGGYISLPLSQTANVDIPLDNNNIAMYPKLCSCLIMVTKWNTSQLQMGFEVFDTNPLIENIASVNVRVCRRCQCNDYLVPYSIGSVQEYSFSKNFDDGDNIDWIGVEMMQTQDTGIVTGDFHLTISPGHNFEMKCQTSALQIREGCSGSSASTATLTSKTASVFSTPPPASTTTTITTLQPQPPPPPKTTSATTVTTVKATTTISSNQFTISSSTSSPDMPSAIRAVAIAVPIIIIVLINLAVFGILLYIRFRKRKTSQDSQVTYVNDAFRNQDALNSHIANSEYAGLHTYGNSEVSNTKEDYARLNANTLHDGYKKGSDYENVHTYYNSEVSGSR